MYVAGYNMPGYLPDNPPEEFETSDEAMAYIEDAATSYVEETIEDEAQASHLIDQISFWCADENGEFGCTFHNYHYFVSKV